jgi:hypothetical protein
MTVCTARACVQVDGRPGGGLDFHYTKLNSVMWKIGEVA